MSKIMYVVLGATGHIGHVICEELLRKDHAVKAIGRDQTKLKALKAKGAETIVIDDFANSTVLTDACKGAKALFSMLPPAINTEDLVSYQDKVGEVIKNAIQTQRIPYILNLSSIGADLPEGSGILTALYRQEQRLNGLPNTNVLHLRPGFFMENLLRSIPTIKQSGMIATPVKGDLILRMIATKDIGKKAAEFLNRLDYHGHHVFDFEGPEENTFVQAAKIIGKAIDKPDLKYVQLSYPEAEKAFISMGMHPTLARQMLEMYKAMNEGRINVTQKLTSEHLGNTTLSQFAVEIAQALRSSAVTI